MVKPLESQALSRSLCAERTLLEGVARALMAATEAKGCLFQLDGPPARRYGFGHPYEACPEGEWPRLDGQAPTRLTAEQSSWAFSFGDEGEAPVGQGLLGPGIAPSRWALTEGLCRQQAHFVAAALGGVAARPDPVEGARRPEREMDALFSLTAAALESPSLEALLGTALNTVLSLSGLSAGLLLYHEAGRVHPHLAATQLPRSLEEALGRFQQLHGMDALYRCLAGDRSEHPDDARLREALGAQVGPWVVLPLHHHDKLLGLLLLAMADYDALSDELSLILATVANQVMLAIERTTAFASLEDQVERRTAELRESHQRLESTIAELQRMDQFKTNFLSNVSHELRTPLSGIIGYGEFLSDEVYGELNDEQKRVLEQLVSNSYHLMELINNLLDLSRIDAGKLQLYLEPIELRTLLMQAAGKVMPQAMQKDIRLIVPDEREPLVEVDPGRIVQVLVNLLSNAIKFTPPEGTIELAVHQERETATVVVRDTGIGIPAEHLPKLFVRFSQGDASSTRRFGGTGLGLAISRELIELHGQRIWVESTPNVGSSFSFTLPIWDCDAEPAIKKG